MLLIRLGILDLESYGLVKPIGDIQITNTGKGKGSRADYDVVIRYNHSDKANPKRLIKEFKIKGFDRREGALSLLKRALNESEL